MGAQTGTEASRKRLQASTGFSDVVLSRPKDPDDRLALVELTVWGSQADAVRAAEPMSGTVGVYKALMRVGEGGPPVFGRPLDMVLFESPSVTEPFFRAEVEVFARISERSQGFSGLLLKNVEEGAEIAFVYLAQWRSEEARAETHKSESFAAALELAKLQKTKVMKFVELHRVD